MKRKDALIAEAGAGSTLDISVSAFCVFEAWSHEPRLASNSSLPSAGITARTTAPHYTCVFSACYLSREHRYMGQDRGGKRGRLLSIAAGAAFRSSVW